jgi:hypothetical protein
MKNVYNYEYDHEDDDNGVVIMMTKVVAAILNVVTLKDFSLLVTSMHFFLRTAHSFF